jgi:hypothetical protein
VKNGQGKRTIADIMAERDAREKIAERWLAIIDNPAHPHHATMLVKGADRLDGNPVQPIGADGGGPVIIERVIIDQAANPNAAGVRAAIDGGEI